MTSIHLSWFVFVPSHQAGHCISFHRQREEEGEGGRNEVTKEGNIKSVQHQLGVETFDLVLFGHTILDCDTISIDMDFGLVYAQ